MSGEGSLHLRRQKQIGENRLISNREKKTILVAICLFLTFIITCILFNRILDGYFMWLYLYKGFLTIYWQRKPLYTIQIPLNLEYPLWVPLIPLIVGFTDLLVMNRLVSSKIVLYGRRVHHYHLGLLAIGAATILLIIMTLTNREEPTTIWLDWKRTSIAEVLQGLSFIFILGGIAFILLDARDIASALITNIRALQLYEFGD